VTLCAILHIEVGRTSRSTHPCILILVLRLQSSLPVSDPRTRDRSTASKSLKNKTFITVLSIIIVNILARRPYLILHVQRPSLHLNEYLPSTSTLYFAVSQDAPKHIKPAFNLCNTNEITNSQRTPSSFARLCKAYTVYDCSFSCILLTYPFGGSRCMNKSMLIGRN
jgi:hypothetical protein